MKNKIVSLLFFTFFISNIFASHYMGGEITWVCTGTGKYIFTLKAFRECNGIEYETSLTMKVKNYPNLNDNSFSFDMNQVSITELSPSCYNSPVFEHIKCEPQPANANTGAMQMCLYVSDTIQLDGVPPTAPNFDDGGWIFYYESCCRNPSNNVINASSIGWSLRAIMYNYDNRPVGRCIDNSPQFAEKPATVLCIGDTFTYNHNAYDPDLDYLKFKWARPMEEGLLEFTMSNYNNGYNWNNPLTCNSLINPPANCNPNNTASFLNAYTGEITFRSFDAGAFVTSVAVESYKCDPDNPVSIVYRDIQVVLLPCGGNNAPVVPHPFQDANNNYTLDDKEIFAEEEVSFQFSGQDLAYLAPPYSDTLQTVTLYASGGQFGANFTDPTSGCPTPPCATLNKVPPITDPDYPYLASTIFHWQTTCAHLEGNSGCNRVNNRYNFLLKAVDNYCPAPAATIKTVSITVKAPPVREAPRMKCVNITNNDSILITWDTIPDDHRNSFYGYCLYSSASANLSSATYIKTITDRKISSYKYKATGALQKFYFMQVWSGCGRDSLYASNISLGIKPLTLIATKIGNIGTKLVWNKPASSFSPSSEKKFKLYREYPIGTWNLIKTFDSTATTYDDYISDCDSYINYRIEVNDTSWKSPCATTSLVVGNLFKDDIVPAIAKLDSVSVNCTNQKAEIGWDANPSGDTEGYIILKNVNNRWVKIDTVFGINNTFYVDLNSTPYTSSETYSVLAFDTCGNISIFDTLKSHNTLLLKGFSDVCSQRIYLNWNKYKNFKTGLRGYKILVKKDNSPIYLPIPFQDNTQDNIILPNVEFNVGYEVYIVAVDSALTASSQSNCLRFYLPQPIQPQFLYLRNATVANTSSDTLIQIRILADSTATVSSYDIWRKTVYTNDTAHFKKIVSIQNIGKGDIIFYDTDALYDKNSYLYVIVANDSCNSVADSSLICRTILLEVSPTDKMTNELKWNDYAGYLGGVNNYLVYRKIFDESNNVTENKEIATVNPGTKAYSDNVMEITGSGKFSYTVVAVEGANNPFAFIEKSRSNEVIMEQPSKFFIPNAFSPDGDYNKVFRPVSLFLTVYNYSFTIFNKWGQMVFQTSDAKMGWDGKYKGEPVEQGVYVYFIKYKNDKGKETSHRGTITLFR